MQNLEISKNYFLGKNLETEKDFLQKVEISFKEQNFEKKLSSRITFVKWLHEDKNIPSRS